MCLPELLSNLQCSSITLCLVCLHSFHVKVFFPLLLKAALAQVLLFIYCELFHVLVSAHSLLLSGREIAYSSIPRGNN